MRLSLNDIPDELVRHILLHLSPETTLLSFQLVSRRYRHLSNEPLLWRFHCLHFRYWNEEHNLSEKVMSRASSVDWKGLWILRKKKNLKAARLLNSILSSSAHQLSRLRDICVMGYDVKDFLLAQIHCPDSAEDVLARR
jgi:F-box protein 21